MIRYFIYLKFKGTNYHGWQIQPNAHSVQAEVQNAFKTMLQKDVDIVAAGRTDTGVHAQMMVVHFDIDFRIEEQKFVHQMNGLLPSDISIDRLSEVKPDFHARFDATSRTYHYKVALHKNPFNEETTHKLHKVTDFKIMNEAAQILLGKKDFSCFSKSHTQTFTNDCEIYVAKWFQTEELWVFEIKANRFLRNMVRAIVGTLLEIGEGKRTVASLQKLIESKNRSDAGTSVPAKGLFLTNIEYPEEGFIR